MRLSYHSLVWSQDHFRPVLQFQRYSTNHDTVRGEGRGEGGIVHAVFVTAVVGVVLEGGGRYEAGRNEMR